MRKRKAHSLADAEQYCKDNGFKYSTKTHKKIKIGDKIEVGNEIWKAVDKKIQNGYSEVSYVIVGDIDKDMDKHNEYFANVKPTKKEQWELDKKYYVEWLEKQEISFI